MEVRGVVVSFEENVQVAKNGGGTYPGARFSYRDENGALKEKGFHNNVFKFNAGLKTQLANLKPGQPFVMVVEKENDFWNVKSVLPESNVQATTSGSNAVGSKTTPSPSPKSTYETPEERAQKQVYIVRQSSINQALEYLGLTKTKPSIEEVLKTASQFESHVFGVEFDDGMPMHIKDDTEGII